MGVGPIDNELMKGAEISTGGNVSRDVASQNADHQREGFQLGILVGSRERGKCGEPSFSEAYLTSISSTDPSIFSDIHAMGETNDISRGFNACQTDFT